MASDTAFGRPQVENLGAKIAALERRAEHLEARLERTAPDREAAANFDRGELRALRAAIALMHEYRSRRDERWPGMKEAVEIVQEAALALEGRCISAEQHDDYPTLACLRFAAREMRAVEDVLRRRLEALGGRTP